MTPLPQSAVDAEREAKAISEAWHRRWVEPAYDRSSYEDMATRITTALAAARSAALEEAARVADLWATQEQKRFGNGGPGAAIRSLLSPQGGK